MKNKKYWLIVSCLGIVAIIIHFFSLSDGWVEQYYSRGVYPYISICLRFLLGWLPFSIGDILYGFIVAWLIFRFIKLIGAIRKKELFSKHLVPATRGWLVAILTIYILFNILWGINYNRQGIASQLGLTLGKYSLEELKTLNGVLLAKTNASKTLLLQQPAIAMSSKEIRLQSQEAYQTVDKQLPFLKYHPASLKTSIWGWLGNYVGFLGYYNPFTGEGQVNSTIPRFLQPYTNCHEIAHQLGYAKENEANFVGYLAAAASKDESFHYSAYLELFLYANRNLFETDSAAAKAFTKDLLPAIRADLKEWRTFNLSHKNPVEPVIRWVYGKYLENNEQPSGVMSYDEVTGFMISYYNKFGRL